MRYWTRKIELFSCSHTFTIFIDVKQIPQFRIGKTDTRFPYTVSNSLICACLKSIAFCSCCFHVLFFELETHSPNIEQICQRGGERRVVFPKYSANKNQQLLTSPLPYDLQIWRACTSGRVESIETN